MKSIRTKIMAGMSITVVVFVLIIGITSIAMSYISSNSQLEQSMAGVAGIASERVHQEIQVYLNIAQAMGASGELSDPQVSDGEKKQLLSQWTEEYGFVRYNLLNEDGISLFDSNSYADQEFFQECMAGNTYISTPVKSKGTDEFTVIVAAPVWKGGVIDSTPVGVVYFVPQETFLNDIMSTIKISEHGSAYMIDKDGYTIADVSMENVMVQNIEKEAGKDKSLTEQAEMHKKMRSGETGVITYERDGESMIGAYAPVAETDGWSLAVVDPKSDFMGATVRAIIVVGILILFSVVVALFIARRIAVRIAGPICMCAERLTTLSQGDLHTEVPEINTVDETGTLAAATKDIVECLRGLIQDEKYVLGEMAGGNFDINADVSVYRGDLQVILKSLNGINHRLSKSLYEISGAADQVAEGSEQVSAGAQAFSQGATEQASSVEELAATINDINSDIQKNAKLAEDSNETSNEAGIMLMESQEKMNHLISAMSEISNSSGEIGRIIKTIEDIAFQTNILALNAAVEAARAGNAGKGFAVVADEVRSLAEKSAEASKSTSTLIERSIHAVENGTQIANDTAEAIQETAVRAKKAVGLVAQILENTKSQAEAVAQVSVGVDQISSVVQTNSATAQQSAAASEELSGQAEMLKKTVNSFRLKDLNSFCDEE